MNIFYQNIDEIKQDISYILVSKDIYDKYSNNNNVFLLPYKSESTDDILNLYYFFKNLDKNKDIIFEKDIYEILLRELKYKPIIYNYINNEICALVKDNKPNIYKVDIISITDNNIIDSLYTTSLEKCRNFINEFEECFEKPLEIDEIDNVLYDSNKLYTVKEIYNLTSIDDDITFFKAIIKKIKIV